MQEPPPRPRTRASDLPGIAIGRLRRALDARLAPRGSRAAILLYHRLAQPDYDTWDLSVSPDRFGRQLDMLTAEFRVLSLRELVRGARRGGLPPRAVALTFDDGYVDNLEVGVPELERRSLPATIYVATGYVGDSRAFWWDELEALLRGPGPRPARLELSLGARTLSLSTSTPAERLAAVHAIQPLLRRGPLDAIEPCLRRLRAWAGRSVEPPSSDVRAVNHEELERLAASGVIEIGAHTRRHPGLPPQPPALQRAEIERSRDDLADWLGSPPKSFSYPLGDHRPTTKRLVRAAGFDHAVSVDERPVTRLTSRWELPRTMALEEDEAVLERRLTALTS